MNTTATVQRLPTALVEFRHQMEQRQDEFAKALPSHIKPDHFQRVTITAVQNNPKLLNVERRSLLNALMRCAADGLLPDGRQAAMVIFRSKEGDTAQYMSMIAGIRKLVQQSGEVTRFEQQVVYEHDKFEFSLGDEAHIWHRPTLKDRGAPIAVYSIAEFKNGSRSREVMSVEDVEKVRRSSRAADNGPWVQWWTEMARKTVARRHAKSLPMSNDAVEVVDRGDGWDEQQPDRVPDLAIASSRPALSDQMDRLAAGADENKPRRGRPPRQKKPERELEYEPDPSDEAGDQGRTDPAIVGGSSTGQTPSPAGELPIDDRDIFPPDRQQR